MTTRTNGAPGGPWTAGLEAVAVADVPSALANRWRAIMRDYPGAGSRSSSLNLITFADQLAAAPVVSAIIGELAAAHPVRAITVVDDDSMEREEVESYILAGCALSSHGAPTCSEEVFLRTNPRTPERAASAVYGLLAADMPVYLWWRGPSPFGNALFKLVAPFADKIIVDSQRFGDTSASLDTVRRLAAKREGHVAVADLNWKRILPWRQAVAACFDDPAVAAALTTTDRCEIFYQTADADPTPHSARASLFAGWAINRMPALRGHTRIVPRKTDEAGSGRIESVILYHSHSKAALRLVRSAAPLGIAASFIDKTGQPVRHWALPAESRTEAELVHYSLDDPSRNLLFEAALAEE
jgi:glucose-6-phosphate dehydrogenase assembly protein OpcA